VKSELEIKKRILVVEDDRLTSYLIITLLKRLGHHIYEPVRTGKDAIESAIINRPDFIFMDIWLEGELNGYDAAAEILTYYDTSIVFISGYPENDIINQSKKINYFAFLKKPLEFNEIEQIFLQENIA